MTALPSTEDLARLAKAITPGPWRRNLENTVCNQIDGEHHAICTDQFCYAPEDQQDANAEAISLMPALIRDVLDRRGDEAGMRALLRTGCDLLADECENLKASITMPDGSLSANPLDAWAVEKVAAIEDWIASVKAALYPTTPATEAHQ
jgi:hypothetical protein